MQIQIFKDAFNINNTLNNKYNNKDNILVYKWYIIKNMIKSVIKYTLINLNYWNHGETQKVKLNCSLNEEQIEETLLKYAH